MNWKALLQTLTAGLVGTGLNWGATTLVPHLGQYGQLVLIGLSVAASFAAKSPWTKQPEAK